jgi:AcrR family transcriptional regulator
MVTSGKPRNASDLNNRARLLQAATDSFAEYGYEGTSLRTIADGAGVSFQLISHYFGTKEELWAATVDYLFDRYLETGKGLGFTHSGNLYEQFRNHLRLLLTDMLQRPQLRKIWIQEYLAGSERYTQIIRPKIEHLYEELSLPYFREVVRLGIVKRYTPGEVALLWSSIVNNNVVYPYYIELALGLPQGSAKSVETQVDLAFAVLTAKPEPDAPEPTEAEATPRGPIAASESPAGASTDALVYELNEARELSDGDNRIKQLEFENLHLKQLVGSLSLENKLLVDRLASLEKRNPRTR